VNFVDQILGSYYRPSAAMAPKDQVKDALANLTGPFGSILVNEVSGLSYLSKWAVTGDQHDLIKAVVNMIPLSGLRSALTAYLWEQGRDRHRQQLPRYLTRRDQDASSPVKVHWIPAHRGRGAVSPSGRTG